MSKEQEQRKQILKKRTDIRCKCRRQKSNEKQRVRYGTCRCDSYTYSLTFGLILANSLFQYVADARMIIVQEDSYWELIEKHADAIKDFAESDSWDELSKEKGVKTKYLRKKKEFKQAMRWLSDNWVGLWW